MALIYAWARVVALAVLFAGLVDMLITSEEMARFVRLILGLVVLLAILSPALALLDQHWSGGILLPAWADPGRELGHGTWERAMQQQMERMVTSATGMKAVRVRVQGSPTQGISWIRVWGGIAADQAARAMEMEAALTAILATYYGVPPEWVTVSLDVMTQDEGG